MDKDIKMKTITYDETQWKLVPIEPTNEMWAAVNKLDDEMAAGGYDGKGCSIEQAWNCLVAAAPEAPQPSQQVISATGGGVPCTIKQED